MASQLPSSTMSKIANIVTGSKADKVAQLAEHSVQPDEKSRILKANAWKRPNSNS